MTSIVTLLSDFGDRDGYVGAMKGALLSSEPGLQLVDLTHRIPFADIAHASYAWAQAAPRFPRGAVHLGVVDPGVGSARRALAVGLGGHVFVAPDNGLLSDLLALREFEWAVAIDPASVAPGPVSPTFHGRDLFAPAAAYLASGGRYLDLGREVPREGLALLPGVALAGAELLGAGSRHAPAGSALDVSVAYVDGFGNVITRLALPEATSSGVAQVGERRIAFRRTYSEVERGELLALRGSLGTLEVACREGDAARILGLAVGDVIKWLALERS